MTLRLHDTRRRAVVPFDAGPEVSIYVCGITPYDSTHLGHAFTYLTHDLVIRRLEDLGHRVAMVRNVTDVDDPLYERAARLGIDASALAEEEIARFRADMVALGARPAIAEPTVSGSIDDIVALVERLQAGGHTYTVEGTTYFDIATTPSFGELSGLDEPAMIDLARRRGGDPDDPRRHRPLDFVLWKPSGEGEHVWDSTVGPGRPGWHIECSAMAMASFGPTVDLHGGGDDLVFPHHECEIAQSTAATDEPLARHWMHVGMVGYEGEKMSKSKGNLVFVSELRQAADPRAIRLALAPFHYRAGFEWTDDLLDAGTRRLELLLAAAGRSTGPDPAPAAAAVEAAIDDDLDTAAAWDALAGLARTMADRTGDDPTAPAALRRLTGLLGVDLDPRP